MEINTCFECAYMVDRKELSSRNCLMESIAFKYPGGICKKKNKTCADNSVSCSEFNRSMINVSS